MECGRLLPLSARELARGKRAKLGSQQAGLVQKRRQAAALHKLPHP